METDGVPQRETEVLGPRSQSAERLAFGLRMTDGVPVTWGQGFEEVLAQIEQHGLLEITNDSLRLTVRGRDLADTVAGEILGS